MDCVNACAGMMDPAQEIHAFHARISALEAANGRMREAAKPMIRQCWMCEGKGHLIVFAYRPDRYSLLDISLFVLYNAHMVE